MHRPYRCKEHTEAKIGIAVPKRLLGAFMGAMFFPILMGVSIAPALLGSVMNASYEAALDRSLPKELHQIADQETMTLLRDPRVLLSQSAIDELEAEFDRGGNEMKALFAETVGAIRQSLKTGY